MAGVTAHSPEIGLEIVHAIPGRVRLKAARGTSLSAVEKIAACLREQTGINEVKLNRQTGSVTIAFTQSERTVQQILELVQGCGVGLCEPWQAAASGQPEAPAIAAVTQSVTQWAAQVESFVPLMVGMLLTQRLGIQGLQALPVYLIAATTTRQVIEQLPLELPLLPATSSSEKNDRFLHSPDAIACRVVQAISGRARFYIPRIASDPAYARRLERLVESSEGVTGVRVNEAAASLIVTYKIGAVSDAARCDRLLDLIQQAGAPALLATPPHSQPPEAAPETAVKNGRSPHLQLVETLPVSTANNGHRQNARILEISPETAVKNGRSPHGEAPALAVLERRNEAFRVPEPPPAPASEKTSFWADYKPPALSMFLAFMANLY